MSAPFRFRALLLLITLLATGPLLAQVTPELILRVGRIRSFIQTNLNIVQPDSQSPYCFSALANPVDGVTTVSSATIRPSTMDPLSMTPLPCFPHVYGLFDCGRVEQDIDADYPPGAYQFFVDYVFLGFLPDTYQSSIQLESNDYPSTSAFLDIDPNLPVSAACDLTLSWSPLIAGRAEDGVSFQIIDPNETNGCQVRVLFQMTLSATNSSPNVVIPANTLLPDRIYHAVLTTERTFASRFDVHDVAGLGLIDLYALTESTFTKITRMPFRTTNSGPCLTVISSPASTPFRFRFPTIVGQGYRIQVSSNLVDWTTVRTTNAATTQVIYEEPKQPAGQKFFRTLSQ
jgi:hypothetical protein